MQIDFESTLAVAKECRSDYWNELTGRYFPGMSVDASPQVEASWTSCAIADVTVSIANSERSIVQRWLTSSPVEASDRILIHLQNHGVSVTKQFGRSAAINSGDMTFCYSDAPYELLISDRNEAIVIDCPRHRFAGLDVPFAQIKPRSLPAVGMMRDLVRSIFRQNWHDDLLEKEAEQSISDTIIALLKGCVADTAHMPAPASDENERVLAFVDQYIDDSSLRTAVIADRLSLPAHSVQKIFAQMGTTPTAYMLNRRLTLAAARLRSHDFDGTLTDLALELGFSDGAHFSRRFRARFDMSPSQYAAKARRHQ